MGDRALIQFVKIDENGKKRCSPALYTHWGGSNVRNVIVGLKNNYPHSGVNKLMANCSREFIADSIYNAPCVLTKEDSFGDKGVFVVEIGEKWIVNIIDGYDDKESPYHPSIIWKYI